MFFLSFVAFGSFIVRCAPHFIHAAIALFCVRCAWLIPNGMNNMASGLFSTELYCLRQIIPQRLIANIFLGHNIEMYGVNGNNMESR